jgi:hypothetical protein
MLLPPTPIAEVSNKALGQHIARERKKLAELTAVELTGPELRAGKGDESLAEMRAVSASIQAAEAERDRRRVMSVDSATVGLRLRARREMEQRRRKPHPAKDVLGKITQFGHPELVGWMPDIYRLTPEEGVELVALVQQKWAASADQPEAEQLSAKQEKRYERLAGKVAGNEKLFAEKRRRADDEAKIAEAKEELRLAGAPASPEVGGTRLRRVAALRVPVPGERP